MSSNFFTPTDELLNFSLPVKNVCWVINGRLLLMKTSVENTIPPLLNAYHVTSSVSRDKHKLEVMTSDDAFFFPSNFFLSTYTQCYSTIVEFNGGWIVVNKHFWTEEVNAAGTTHDRYYIQDVFFWHLAGPVAPTGKAIVHWIGCINAIKI